MFCELRKTCTDIVWNLEESTVSERWQQQQQVYFKLNIAYKACAKAIQGGYKRKKKIL